MVLIAAKQNILLSLQSNKTRRAVKQKKPLTKLSTLQKKILTNSAYRQTKKPETKLRALPNKRNPWQNSARHKKKLTKLETPNKTQHAAKQKKP